MASSIKTAALQGVPALRLLPACLHKTVPVNSWELFWRPEMY